VRNQQSVQVGTVVFCPVRATMDLLGQKWTLHVVRELVEGKKRFNQLAHALGGVNSRTLRKRLLALETEGIIVREARDEVGQAELISPDEGLVEFRKLSGIGEALNALTDNPLPWLVRVHPAAQNDSAAAVEMLAAELRQLPEVELVEADTAWVRRLDAILDALRQVVVLAAAVLALGVLAIVGNTIRLDINSRRAEIEVTKLVGGSNAFVRRPFLYSGFWQGLAGGLLAVALIATGLAILEAPIARVAAAYGASFTLQGLATREWLAVIGGGATLGLLGAWLAAAYHLHRIEPRA